MKLISLILCLFTSTVFAKSYVMPNPFLSPLVQARLSADQNWVPITVSGEFFYGARRANKPIIVEMNRLVQLEDIEFFISTGVKNDGPYVNILNVALVKGDKKFSFPVTSTNFVASYDKQNIDISFSLNTVCEELGCNFEEGELVYLYLDHKGFREIAPIYEWDYMFGAFYLFKYK